MIRNYITVNAKGEVKRHYEPEEAAALISSGEAVTVIEIAPELAEAGVRLYLVDEDGLRMEEIQ